MSPEAQREAFEKWALSGHAAVWDLLKDSMGNYTTPETHCAWMGWKAAIASSPPLTGYRLLNIGEPRQEGDEFYHPGTEKWVPMQKEYLGIPFDPQHLPVRRPFTPLPSPRDTKSLDEQIAKRSEADVRKHYATSLLDWAETDTRVRESARRVLDAFLIDGDSYGVPCIEDIVDRLVERIESHQVSLSRAVVEQVEKALEFISEGKHESQKDLSAQQVLDLISERSSKALSALRSLQPESPWRPIETAPRDGADIIIAYISDQGELQNVDVGAWKYDAGTNTPDAFEPPYWYWESFRGGIEEPTHWIPLPPNPSSTGGEE